MALPISEITFEGNAVTKEKVLRQEMLVHEGDEADPKLIEESRLAIMNLGLFKTVISRLEEDGAGQRLIFSVEERFYLLPIPLIGVKAKDDNILGGVGSYNYGLELRYDNVFGLNQRLKLIYEDEESQDLKQTKKTTAAMSYEIPRFIDSPYHLELEAKEERKRAFVITDEEVSGFFRRKAHSGGFYLSRLLDPEGISTGWSVGAGVNAKSTKYDERSGTALDYADNFVLEIEGGINYKDVQEYPYHRAGETYGYGLSVASPQLDSDVDYTRHIIYFRRYQPLHITDSNLNTQLQIGIATGDGPAYKLGKSTLLRGYENDFVEGNAMLLFNAEYHHHISNYRQLRAVIFVDAGNAWERAEEEKLDTLYTGAGIGFRWRVQSFVDFTLRLDYGWAIGYDNNSLFMNTSTSF